MGQRKAPHEFIELIFDAEGKYPNWDPEKEIRVGDYGVINKATATFRRKGNIYDDPTIRELIPNLDDYQPVVGQSADYHEVVARTGKSAGVHAAGQVNTPVGSQALFEGSWGFKRERGAVFVMRNAMVVGIPIAIPDSILNALINTHKLKDMGIVTEVWMCSGYVRYLSSKGGDNFSVTLVADVPVPLAPGVSVGGSLSARWECSRGAGSFKEAHPKGPPIYSGMYTLKLNERKKRAFFRGSGMLPEGEGCEKLGNYRPPWEDDEDFEGEDESFDDDTEEVNEEEP